MGDGVPDHVENEFQSYLRCGILAHGFARARCSGCGRGSLSIRGEAVLVRGSGFCYRMNPGGATRRSVACSKA